MSEKMNESSDDLSAVAWVHEELRRSLDAAHKALRRFGREAEAVDGSDVDVVDPAVLRTARAQIHQGVGALELVGLPAAALVLRASETLVQRAATRPQTLTPAVIGDIERASFALLDYLSRMLAGKVVSPLSLFPQYRAVQDAAEAQRVHPADLWSVDWRWRELPDDPGATAHPADPEIHDALEGQLLALMRGAQPEAAARRISDICADLGAGATDPEVATLWKLASAMFQAQGRGLLGFDLYTKRVASRLLAQFRILERGESDVSERLARDLLFFCAQSAPAGAADAPRVAAARQAYAIADEAPVDYSVSVLGRFDPAMIVHARKRVAAAKEAWSAVAGGEMHRLAGLNEQFSLVGDSLKRLFPFGEVFAAELQQAAAQTQAANAAPPAPLAMEVATSLLYTEAALEDADFDDPEHAARVQRLAERLAAVRQKHPPEPLEGWMEELYRRVSDRQTMGSVVQELRASLSEAEKSIDQFFRNPAEPNVLIAVPQQLAAMRGVLSVLGMDHASAALLRMRDEVDGLASTEVDPARVVQAGVFDRLAGNLSALGFLIDMLSVQPQMAKSLFAYDAETGVLSPVMGRAPDIEHMSIGMPGLAPSVEPRLLEQAQMLAFSSVRDDVPLQEVTRELERLSHEAQAADQPALAATVLKAQEAFGRAGDAAGIATARGELSEALVDFVATASEPDAIEPEPALAPRAMVTPALEISDFQEDDEMRGIFLEEAREVIQDAGVACRSLERAPADLTLLTALRRAFHTLKGSSRMVGLKAFGDAAWTCEQLYNTHLAEQRAAEPALVEFTTWSLGYLGAWSDDIAAHRPTSHDAATVQARADALAHRLQGGAPSDIALPLGMPPDLPSAAELDLPRAPVAPVAPFPAFAPAAIAPAAPGPAPVEESEALAFELDLSALDAPPAPPLQPYSTAQPHLDPNVQALFDPFDVQPTAAMPLAPTVDVEVDDIVSGPVDLDLGDEPAVDPFIRNLEPSRAGAVAARPMSDMFDAPGMPAPVLEEALPELVLDLSDPELRDDPARADAIAPPDATPTIDAAAARTHAVEAAEIAGTAHAAAAAQSIEGARSDDDLVKVVGPLRISIPLFNIYLNEADELSRRLTTEVAEWAMELHRPIGEAPIALAHSLAGSSATVGFADLSHLARVLEHAQMRSQSIGHGTPEEARLFVDAADEVRRLLHQFAAGFLREPSPELLQRLAEHEVSSAHRLEAATAADELAPGGAPAVPSVTESAALGPLLVLDDPLAAPEWRAAPASASAPQPDQDSIETTPSRFDEIAEADTEFADSVAAEHAIDITADGSSTADGEPTAPSVRIPVGEQAIGEPAAISESRAAESLAASREDEVTHSAFGALPGHYDPLGVSELKPFAARPTEALKPVVGHENEAGLDADDDIDAQDAVDAELFPIFEEEGLELIPQLAAQLREWVRDPADVSKAAGCMRTLHTLKGGARLAGAMRLGEMAHRLETRIERLLAHPPAQVEEIEALQVRCDGLAQTLEAVRRSADARAGAPVEAVAPAAPMP
ncbi:MAG: Hpt domain-containing protein, partial [Caldimonas sp.]